MSTFEQTAARLIAVEELGTSRVTVVDKSSHGALAVGISRGKRIGAAGHRFRQRHRYRTALSLLTGVPITAMTVT